MGTIDVEGLAISYLRAGSGPAIVLLHGGVTDHRDWSRQVRDLAADHTVVAWDAPGCGGSSDPPQSFRMPDYADVLAGLIRELALERPHVLGLSWGSTLALELYRRHPHVPRSMILTAAYAGWAGSLSADEVEQRLRSNLRALDDFDPTTFADPWLPTLFTSGASPDLVDECRRVIEDARPDGIRPMLRSMAEADLNDVLPTIRVPTLLIYGELDERSPLPVAEAMHDAIPGSTLVTIPAAGHMVSMEAPESFNEAVRDFLRRNR